MGVSGERAEAAFLASMACKSPVIAHLISAASHRRGVHSRCRCGGLCVAWFSSVAFHRACPSDLMVKGPHSGIRKRSCLVVAATTLLGLDNQHTQLNQPLQKPSPWICRTSQVMSNSATPLAAIPSESFSATNWRKDYLTPSNSKKMRCAPSRYETPARA